MKQGLVTIIGNIVTAAGGASGVAGKNLSIVMGDGNAAGNSSGGSLLLKPGNSSGTGAAGVIQILPTKSTAGGTTALQLMGINGTGYVGFKAPDTITTNTVWQLSLIHI